MFKALVQGVGRGRGQGGVGRGARAGGRGQGARAGGVAGGAGRESSGLQPSLNTPGRAFLNIHTRLQENNIYIPRQSLGGMIGQPIWANKLVRLTECPSSSEERLFLERILPFELDPDLVLCYREFAFIGDKLIIVPAGGEKNRKFTI